jgi:hypothetical protein
MGRSVAAPLVAETGNEECQLPEATLLPPKSRL